MSTEHLQAIEAAVLEKDEAATRLKDLLLRVAGSDPQWKIGDVVDCGNGERLYVDNVRLELGRRYDSVRSHDGTWVTTSVETPEWNLRGRFLRRTAAPAYAKGWPSSRTRETSDEQRQRP